MKILRAFNNVTAALESLRQRDFETAYSILMQGVKTKPHLLAAKVAQLTGAVAEDDGLSLDLIVEMFECASPEEVTYEPNHEELDLPVKKHGMEVERSVFSLMRNRLNPLGTKPLVRLSLEPASYFDHEFVQKCINDLDVKLNFVLAGIDNFTETEILAYNVLKDSAGIQKEELK